MCIYIYIYRERERDIGWDGNKLGAGGRPLRGPCLESWTLRVFGTPGYEP